MHREEIEEKDKACFLKRQTVTLMLIVGFKWQWNSGDFFGRGEVWRQRLSIDVVFKGTVSSANGKQVLFGFVFWKVDWIVEEWFPFVRNAGYVGLSISLMELWKLLWRHVDSWEEVLKEVFHDFGTLFCGLFPKFQLIAVYIKWVFNSKSWCYVAKYSGNWGI